MRPWIKRSILIIIILCSLYFGFYIYKLYISINENRFVYNNFDENEWSNPLNETSISENINIYSEDQKIQVDSIYATILDDDYDVNISENSVKIYFEDGSKKIFQNGIFVNEPNATLELKGKLSSKILQKSFKIRLFDKEGLWHNQNIINLNKHYEDTLKIRNKLSFDYFKIIPNITSFRTQFVRLFIKETENGEFVDYGFFTQIEQPNKLFLTNHGLDPNGHLYQAENFNFKKYDDILTNKDDENYSKKMFENILKIKGNDNHQKLIDMLNDVNDYNKDINDIIDTYFNRDNYLTWLGINILFDNYKTSNTNYFLYSPLNSNKWYFMPWDYDEAWGLQKDRPSWQKGLSVYWDNELHRRFFMKPENIKDLDKKLQELTKIINKEQTKAFLNSYYDIVFTNITKLPDFKYLPVTFEDFKEEYVELPKLTERNYFYYKELIQNPMPIKLKQPIINEDNIIFNWEESYDIQNDELFYDFELSKDKSFSNIIISSQNIKETRFTINKLEKGSYYWRVIVRDSQGNSQISYNGYKDEFGDGYFGIEKLVVR